MASLSNCMECGGIISSEAKQCPHCKKHGIHGVKCHACGEISKFSEAVRITKPSDQEKDDFFHNSCYQQVRQKIVEKKKIINCPLCAQPNQFSYAKQGRHHMARLHTEDCINCSKCGHPYKYEQTQENDPYTQCTYCEFIVEKSLEVLIKQDYFRPNAHSYAHKLCYTNERQAEELRRKEHYENSNKELTEKAGQEMKKKAQEKFESKLRGAFWPALFMGGLSLAMGVWAILLFGILFGLYLIIGNE